MDRSRERRVDALLWALAFVAVGLTLWFSFGVKPPGAEAFPQADKVEHAGAYFVTTLLLLLAAVWRPGRGPGLFWRWRWLVLAVVVVAGGVVELAQQLLTAHRKGDVLDWVAEIMAVLGAVGVLAWSRRRARPGADVNPMT